jgi:hypothetical protein
MSKEEQDFIDQLNGTGEYAPKQVFKGTGTVGKSSAEAIWSSNKRAYQEEAGKFGKELAKWVKNERENTLLVNREDIINELRKEGRYNE